MLNIPLSERLRPKKISEISGHQNLIGPEGLISRIIQSNKPLSLLLFGPPGCGKTTLARLYAKAFHLPFTSTSAVFQSGSDLKKILIENQNTPLFSGQTILFVDEIHRFNRSQQDIFLPFLEDGSIILVGATTQNPSFTLNSALLSRLRILTMNHLQDEDLEKILNRYESCVRPLPLDFEARKYLLTQAQGDGRHLLNSLETLERFSPDEACGVDRLAQILQKKPALYDKDKEAHYQLISALHKSIRGSDPDAALYWFARMLEGGEDPLFIARRLVRIASEDIGLADPEALRIALTGAEAYERLGSAEGELALSQTVVYLALSPKSNAAYRAYAKARELASKTTHLPPPKSIINAANSWMKEQGYGAGYTYDHDTAEGISRQEYFPENLPRATFYNPFERGFEREMKKRLLYFKKFRANS